MLSEKQKKQLRALAHPLHPVVMIGNAGLTANVQSALDEALLCHELVKLRVAAADRAERDLIIQQATANSGAELIQRIGHIAVLYRRHPNKPVISL